MQHKCSLPRPAPLARSLGLNLGCVLRVSMPIVKLAGLRMVLVTLHQAAVPFGSYIQFYLLGSSLGHHPHRMRTLLLLTLFNVTFCPQDLGAPDPLLVLPLFASGTLLLMSEVGADGMAAGATSTRMRLAMRGIAVLMVPMTMNFSSGVFIYFATSNMFSLAQTILLRVRNSKAHERMMPYFLWVTTPVNAIRHPVH